MWDCFYVHGVVVLFVVRVAGVFESGGHVYMVTGMNARCMYLFIYTSIYGCEPRGRQNYLIIPARSYAIELFPRCARGKLYHPRFIPERPLVGISVVRTLIRGCAMQN